MSGRVEPDEFEDVEDAGEIEWLEGDEEFAEEVEDTISARSARLPAPTTRHRAVASLLLVGAVLAVCVYAADSVYRRDLLGDVAADELILAAPPRPGVSLPALEHLASAGRWTERPRTEVAVPLVNRGPDPITLLPGATLLGVGLSASSLGADAATVLGPGQATLLRGYVTADCVYSRPDSAAAAETSLMISARTSGGGLGVSAVALGSDGGSVRDRICAAQSGAVAGLDLGRSADPGTRSITLSFDAISHADVPLGYTMSVAFDPGTWLGAEPKVSGPRQGMLGAGASVAVAYSFPVTDCARAERAAADPADATATVGVDVHFSIGTDVVASSGAEEDISDLISRACG
jgi:hypothetical protein